MTYIITPEPGGGLGVWQGLLLAIAVVAVIASIAVGA